ncbi:MAG: DUF427 domain-containing protein, partial [Streptosporangiaceae bacterium]
MSKVHVEPGLKRVRAYLAGQLVADTRRPLLVWEVPYYPAYYFPAADVRAELVRSGKADDAVSYDVRVENGAVAAGAARSYPDSPIDKLRGMVRF